MADRIELTLRPKQDVPPLDRQTADRIQGIVRGEAVELRDGAAVFAFPVDSDQDAVRGDLELAARFVLGAHWHTRYELVDGEP